MFYCITPGSRNERVNPFDTNNACQENAFSEFADKFLYLFNAILQYHGCYGQNHLSNGDTAVSLNKNELYE